MNADQLALKIPVSFVSGNIQLTQISRHWPFQQTRLLNPLSLPLAALWLPRARRKRDKDCDLVDEAAEVGREQHSRKRPRGKEDLQKLARLVSSRVGHQIMVLRRQAVRLQQRAKEQRGAKRAAKHADRKRHKGEGHRFFHRRTKPEAAAAELVARAQEHERQLDLRSAIRCYEEAAELLPTSCQNLAMCSKAWSDTTYLDEIRGGYREKLTDDMKRHANEMGVAYSEKALAADPQASLPHVAACVSMGRLALLSDNKVKVRLAKEAREHAILAIAKEPNNDLAHHLMGRWHWEMAQLNVVVRTLIRLAFGTALPPGSHEDALESYARATELNPGRLIHRVELGRAYHKLGRRKEAWRELEAAVLLDVEDINAHLQKIDADDLLKSLRPEAKRHSWAAESSREEDSLAVATPSAGQQGFEVRLPHFQLPASLRAPKVSWPMPFRPKQASLEQSQSPADAPESPRTA